MTVTDTRKRRPDRRAPWRAGLDLGASERRPRLRVPADRVSPPFQGPLLLAFEEDPLQQPLALAVRRVSSVARSARDKVSGPWPGAGRPLPRTGGRHGAGGGAYSVREAWKMQIRTLKRPGPSSPGKQTNKMWSLRAMENYPSLQRDEALTRTTAWMGEPRRRDNEGSHTQSPMRVTPFERRVPNGHNRQRQKDGRLPGPAGVASERTWTGTALGAEFLLGAMKMF